MDLIKNRKGCLFNQDKFMCFNKFLEIVHTGVRQENLM